MVINETVADVPECNFASNASSVDGINSVGAESLAKKRFRLGCVHLEVFNPPIDGS